ncbi:ribosomal protein S10 domain-containing protein [Dipodascopsis uninucleata]
MRLNLLHSSKGLLARGPNMTFFRRTLGNRWNSSKSKQLDGTESNNVDSYESAINQERFTKIGEEMHTLSSTRIFKGTGRPMPLNVELNYYAPLKLKSSLGNRSCELQLRSYTPEQVEIFSDFAMRAAFYLNMPISNSIPLPKRTERWTVANSPFAHSKTKTNYERITHKRLLQVKDANIESIELWLAFLRKHELPGVAMKANVYNRESIELD